MPNYKWVKKSENYVELREEDFSSIASFEVNKINPILMKKINENGINAWIEGDDFLEKCRYVLTASDSKNVIVTAPLYKFDINVDEFVLLSESYTDTTIDPAEYEWVKETYLRCEKEVASEQEKIFEEQFMEKSLDGISSFVLISSDFSREPNYFYEQYIPEGYIKVCERNCPFTRFKHEVVFIKKMDARGQEVTIKIPDLYKGLVFGKGHKNIKRIEKMINAKKINVI